MISILLISLQLVMNINNTKPCFKAACTQAPNYVCMCGIGQTGNEQGIYILQQIKELYFFEIFHSDMANILFDLSYIYNAMKQQIKTLKNLTNIKRILKPAEDNILQFISLTLSVVLCSFLKQMDTIGLDHWNFGFETSHQKLSGSLGLPLGHSHADQSQERVSILGQSRIGFVN